jgi:hypothetical protein
VEKQLLSAAPDPAEADCFFLRPHVRPGPFASRQARKSDLESASIGSRDGYPELLRSTSCSPMSLAEIVRSRLSCSWQLGKTGHCNPCFVSHCDSPSHWAGLIDWPVSARKAKLRSELSLFARRIAQHVQKLAAARQRELASVQVGSTLTARSRLLSVLSRRARRQHRAFEERCYSCTSPKTQSPTTNRPTGREMLNALKPKAAIGADERPLKQET